MAKKESTTKKALTSVIKKITNSDVLDHIKNAAGRINVPEEEVTLYTVIGTIQGYVTGNTTNGDFIKFKGDFVAVLADGSKEFRAPFMLIPTPMDIALANQFDAAVAELADENGETPKGKRASCEMAVRMGYKPSNTPTGYEWTMQPVIEIAPTNALEALKERVLKIGHDS